MVPTMGLVGGTTSCMGWLVHSHRDRLLVRDMPARPSDPAWLQTLIAIMEARGIATWAELARRSGIAEATARMMAAGASPGPEVRGKVARALDVDQMSIWTALTPGERRPRHRTIRIRAGEKASDKL